MRGRLLRVTAYLLPATWLQKFLLLLGDGATGKSVTCEALTGLLGSGNVASVPIEQLRNPHALVGTLGKLVNISTEFERIDSETEGLFKCLVGGDRMSFNPKYKPIFSAVPTARIVVASNGLPHFRDRSSGIYRRMVVLPFSVVIPEAERNPTLAEELLEELNIDLDDESKK